MRSRTITTILGLTVMAIGLSGCFEAAGPLARFSATPAFDYPPLETVLDASASSSSDGVIVAYDWDFGDGETGTGAVVTHTYEEKGVYDVTLVVTDSAGKTGARVQIVEALNRAPHAIFADIGKRIAMAVDIEFDASDSYDTDGEIVSYEWDFGDGGTGYGEIVVHSYPRENLAYRVTLTVIDDSGDRDRYDKTIYLNCCGGY
jgi:PKD repeat protein